MEIFSEPTRQWFEATFAKPTQAQQQAWENISHGHHTLVSAPTGSGKTLAAFLWAIDRLTVKPNNPGYRVIYVSPLKALAVDVDKNLRAPLRGIALTAQRLGLTIHEPIVDVRTGDTSARERHLHATKPNDILITTPESLYLMTTSRARKSFEHVEYLIIDEIHSLASNKRGAHLTLTMERLEEICDGRMQRIGLSATQRPLSVVGEFLAGQSEKEGQLRPRPVQIVEAQSSKKLDLEVTVVIEDMSRLGEISDDLATGPQPNARASIWPSIHPELVRLINEHRSTIVFCNSRRLAERLAAAINELAETDLVKAHHGSLAREQRSIIEDDLKSGRLRGLIATSSMELGIDMGAVDLVIQIESPGSVARGIQRVGRAGHSVDAVSKGRIFPKHRGDLLESAVVARAMRLGNIETTTVIQNPLDILCQQIVAMCAVEDRTTDDLLATVRRATPFKTLTKSLFEACLDMLSGRYPSTDFNELRPRLNWDRLSGVVSARPGALRIAVTSGGSIPDRGLYGVFTVGGGRVGELDEEMVYESRPGEVFMLGASSWRIEDITHDRVIVTPAPGMGGKMPFWRGPSIGRPVELGEEIGRATRALCEAKDPQRTLIDDFALDKYAASNLVNYLAEQQDATAALPDDRTIVVEKFRDEIGDWRVCLMSIFGSRVHAPWAIAIEEKLREQAGIAQVLWSDDGIVFRLDESVDELALDQILLDGAEAVDLVRRAIATTPMFASTFRECAARALLLPRRDPARRSPLWLQRMRAASLLSAASRHTDFPILLEAARECLRDNFDLGSLSRILDDLKSRKIRVVEATTDRPSPFAQSLVFGWMANWMYEGDSPLAERRAAALALDPTLLAELLGTGAMRELLDCDAIDELEQQLQRLTHPASTADGVSDLLREVGDLTDTEIAARTSSDPSQWIAELVESRRVIAVMIASEQRYAAVEDAARLRDALGVSLPQGLPSAFTESVESPLDDLVSRYAKTHAPFTASAVAQRFALSEIVVIESLKRLEERGGVVSGEFTPNETGLEWCDSAVLRRLKRKVLALRRAEIEPVEQIALAKFLPAWHGIGERLRSSTALIEALGKLQGIALVASSLDDEIFGSRIDSYTPSMLDALVAEGALVWAGASSIGPKDGRIVLTFRDAADLLPVTTDPFDTPLHNAIRERLSRGACFWLDILAATNTSSETVVLEALWDLVWSSEVTSDTLAPLRALTSTKRTTRRSSAARPGRLSRVAPPTASGRWSLTSDISRTKNPTQTAHLRANQMLERWGVVVRESAAVEALGGGWSSVYGVFKAMEEAGQVRRGWFVAGLGATQFATPGAVDRLRAMRDTEVADVVLAATDPAQPYGAILPWPESAGRPARTAGALVCLANGALVAYIEPSRRSVLTFQSDISVWAPLVSKYVRRLERIDGKTAAEFGNSTDLLDAGYSETYRGWIRRSPNRELTASGTTLRN